VTIEREAAVARSLSRASSLAEVTAVILAALDAVELRGYIAELRGDELCPIGTAIPAADAAGIEELTGIGPNGASVPVAGVAWLSTLVSRRISVHDESFPSRLIEARTELTETEKARLRRHLGAGPLFAVPIAAGDSLLGVLAVWGPMVMQHRSFVETLAAQAALAWRSLRHGPENGPAAATPRPSKAGVRQLLDGGSIRMALQPVIRLTDRSVLGFEALCRFPPRPGLETPEQLFAGVAGTDLEAEVQAACLTAGFAAGRQVGQATLFLNVAVELLIAGARGDGELARLAEAAGIVPSNVVLEVSERIPVDDLSRLRRVVADLRGQGFRIGIDDAGAGHASMLVIAEVQPEFVKIDHRLVHAVDASAARQALVVSLLSFGAHINARVIAEGIETAEELKTLMSLGVQFGQGWHLGRPAVVAPAGDLVDVIEVGPRWFEDRGGGSFQSAPPYHAPADPVTEGPKVDSPVPVDLPTALINAATALQSEHDPRGVLAVIASQLQLVVPVDDLTIYAADQASHRFVPVFANGTAAGVTLAHSFSMDLGITGWAFGLGTPQYVPNSNNHAAAMTIPGTPVDEQESMLLIPLIAGDRALGMLNCRRLGVDLFSEKDLEAASLFGHTAAAAWRNAELYAELSERATTDPLTGLLNSRWLRDVGDRELAQSDRSGRPMAILLIDLDHFKDINDSAGHATGDLVLRRVATELRAMVRAGDAAVRLGGEEFILMLRDADVAAALRIAEAFRSRLANLSLPRDCLPRQRLTASIGIAGFPDQAQTLQALVKAADAAMYTAKRAGRDRACVYTGPESIDGDAAATGAVA
jgi:diguanylate cyclase (GGDEF)-like protein